MSRCDHCQSADLTVFGHAYDCPAWSIKLYYSASTSGASDEWIRRQTETRMARLRLDGARL